MMKGSCLGCYAGQAAESRENVKRPPGEHYPYARAFGSFPWLFIALGHAQAFIVREKEK